MPKKLITVEEANEYLAKKCKTIILNSQINSAIEKLQLKCECGEIFETSWHKIKTQNKFYCNKCSRLKRDNNDRIKKEKEIRDIIKEDGNELLSEYINNTSKLIIKCSCGNIFETTWSSYRNVRHQKRKCNNCSQTYRKYEEKMVNALQEMNINFIREKTFEGLKISRSLRFDFYLPDYNCCVEIDEKGHNTQEYKRRYGINDKLKLEYCMNNNIKLIKIPVNKKTTKEKLIDIIKDIVSSYMKV